MSKNISKLKNSSFFLFISTLAVLILTLSFLNLKTFFADQEESWVLSAEKEVFDDEEYWSNFFKINSSYFPGYIELTQIQISKKEFTQASETLLKAKDLNPNSPLILKLEQSLK